jgi:hypothetical protein
MRSGLGRYFQPTVDREAGYCPTLRREREEYVKWPSNDEGKSTINIQRYNQ